MSVSFQASPFASPPARAGGGGASTSEMGGEADGIDMTTVGPMVAQLIAMQGQCRILIDQELFESAEKLGACLHTSRPNYQAPLAAPPERRLRTSYARTGLHPVRSPVDMPCARERRRQH